MKTILPASIDTTAPGHIQELRKPLPRNGAKPL
jgi:hypothetical protein